MGLGFNPQLFLAKSLTKTVSDGINVLTLDDRVWRYNSPSTLLHADSALLLLCLQPLLRLFQQQQWVFTEYVRYM